MTTYYCLVAFAAAVTPLIVWLAQLAELQGTSRQVTNHDALADMTAQRDEARVRVAALEAAPGYADQALESAENYITAQRPPLPEGWLALTTLLYGTRQNIGEALDGEWEQPAEWEVES